MVRPGTRRPIGQRAGWIVRSVRTVHRRRDFAVNPGFGSRSDPDDPQGRLSGRHRVRRPKTLDSELCLAAKSPTATDDSGSTCSATRNRRGRGLTAWQRRFVVEHLIELNATQAAIRAGYSRQTARAIGSENLMEPCNRAGI